MTTSTVDALAVHVSETRTELGRAAAARAANALRTALADQRSVRLMLAAAPSQAATLAALVEEPDIDWSRVECFHMDDYLGLASSAPQGFGNWLQAHFFDHVEGAIFFRIDTESAPERELERYGRAMGTEPFDVVMLGLGVNGHLAFNDPPADFFDQRPVRVVELDRISRQQQVDEGHFPSFEDVPARAITVTIPRLLHSREVIASVPGSAKRTAVEETLSKPIGPKHPGTALRIHPNAALFLDADSAPRTAG